MTHISQSATIAKAVCASPMRHTLLLLMAAMMCACGPSDNERQLDDILIVMGENPDSALTMLEALPEANMRTDREQAMYAVAQIGARYFAGEDLDTITLKEYAPYFLEARADRAKMYYLYFIGLSKTEHREYTSAILALLESAQIGESEHNHLALGRIYRAIMDVYMNIYQGPQTLKYAERALENFSKYGEQQYINWQLWHVGVGYFNVQEYEKAKEFFKQSYLYAQEAQDSALIHQNQTFLARCDMLDGDYRYAIDKLISYQDNWSNIDQYTLSFSYLKLGNIDSAKLFHSYMDSTDACSIELSYKIAKRENRDEDAYRELFELHKKQSTEVLNILVDDVEGVESEFYKAQEEREKLKYYNILNFTICIASALLILILLAIWKYRRDKSLLEKRIQDFIISFEILEDKLNTINAEKNFIEEAALTKDKDIQQLTDQKKELKLRLLKNELEQRSELLLDLSRILGLQQLYTENHKGFVNSAVKDANIKTLRKVSNLIDQSRLGESQYRKIEREVNSMFGNIMKIFKSEFPSLYKSFKFLFLYKALDLPVHTIAFLLDLDEKSVYNKTYYLKTKIQKSDSNHKNTLLAIL